MSTTLQVVFDEEGKACGVTSEGETAKCKKIVCDPCYLSDKVNLLFFCKHNLKFLWRWILASIVIWTTSIHRQLYNTKAVGVHLLRLASMTFITSRKPILKMSKIHQETYDHFFTG